MNHKIISKITSGALLCSILVYTTTPVFAYTKEETVYSKLDTNGSHYQTIVNSHIQNEEHSELIHDLSDLLNIQNVNGNEQFKQEGTTLTWTSNGNDIYYQGESKKALPIECKITYTLDGKEISAKELAGKSGNVKITLEYINKEEHIVTINGKSEKMYTPFVVLCGTIVDNVNNKNIKITNGKVIDDGTKTTLIGMCLPGLQESLNISKNQFEIPNTIEISMEARDFELNNIMTFVTPKIIEDSDFKSFNQLDDIYYKVSLLQSSSKQLVNGSSELKKGATQLTNGTQKLKDGISSAYDGASLIKSEIVKSTNQLKADKSDALDSNTLSAIKTQAIQSATLTEEQKTTITKQAKESSILTSTLKAQITAQAKKNSILTDAQKASIKVQAKENAILTDTQKTSIKAQAETSAILSESQKNRIIAEAEMAIAPETLTDAQKVLLITVAQNTATQTAIQAALSTAQTTATQTAIQTALSTAQEIATQTAVQTALSTAQEIATQTAIQTALSTAQTTAKETAGTTAMMTAKQVGNQAKTLFTNQVVTQMNTLQSGLSELANGLSELNTGATSLTNGEITLNDGINTLSNGISKLHTEGINPLYCYISDDIRDITIRLEKLQELSEQYNHFTILDQSNNGSVKFIMIIDNIKKENALKENMILSEEKKEQ